MPLAKPSAAPSWFITFAAFVLVVVVLRLAEDVMIPVALSLMLAFLLSPLVVRLQRWRLPKPIAILVTAAIAFSAIGCVGWQIADQTVALMKELPRYEENLRQKAAGLQPQSSVSLRRAILTLERMWADLQISSAGAEPSAAGRDSPKPVPVEVRNGDRPSIELGREALTRLIQPVSTAGIVVVFVIVILFQSDDLRNRFIRVIGGGRLNLATEAVDDAAQRVSRYLFAQLLVNTFFGVVVGAGLYFIGVPHAALWGLLSTLLRFIPFLGPLIAAAFPLALAAAVDPGWSMLWWTVALYGGAELLTNNVIEVWAYGSSTGISALALITAAVFWSWLWGLPGLVLSTPLTVCLLVVGQHVTGLRFLSVLLGSEPPLDPAAQFYQHMLSMDQEEMFAMADAHTARHSLANFYDDVFVPALLMSEVDRHNGVLAEVRQKFIVESSRELIDELGARPPKSNNGNAAPPNPPPRADAAATPVVLAIPARDEADELVAIMLAQILTGRGLRTDVAAVADPMESHLDRLNAERVTVCLSALPPSTLSSAGRVCRHIKRVNRSTRVLVGVWSSGAKLEYLKGRLDPAGADGIALRLSDAAAQLENLARSSPNSKEPKPESGVTKITPRTEPKLAATRLEEAADTVARELARTFEVPIALIAIVESDRDFWKLSQGVPANPTFAHDSAYADVFSSDVLLAVEDVAKDERFSAQALFAKRGVRSFASAPLRTQNGHNVGNLCVLDTQPRTFSEADKELLESLAAQLMEALESSASVRPAPEVVN